MSTRLDPDELALLEEQREHLLASLDDLEREHAVGDITDDDYATLKDDYTLRASKVLAAIEQQRALVERPAEPRRPVRTIAVVAAVLAFAVVAGVLVARSAGQRGDGPITGEVNTMRARLSTCQQASFRDPEGGVECYDELLADAPDNVEALTYRGWAMIRLGEVLEGTQNLGRAAELDPEYPDVRVFLGVVAARAGEHERAAQEIDRFYRNAPTPAAIGVLRSQGLERDVFVELLDRPTRACWQAAAEADEDGFLDELAGCLDALLATDPDNVDALVSRTYAAVGPDTTDLAAAVALADRAVAAAPEDPNALLVRASLAAAEQRNGEADADLDALEGLPRPTASFLFGGPEQIRDAMDR